jgi:hypothetical protein
MTTFTKLTSAKSQEQMRAIIEKAKGSIYAEPHADGFEIRDMRPLVDRLNNPVKGRGMKHFFSDTHMVVSAGLLEKFNHIKA